MNDRTGLEWWENRPDLGTGGMFAGKPLKSS